MKEISPEHELDEFINHLNQERRPNISENPDTADLQSIARVVKGLRSGSGPREEFTESLYSNLVTRTGSSTTHSMSKDQYNRTRKTFFPWVALVACLLVAALVVIPLPFKGTDVVLAMAQEVQQLQNYHGIMEKISSNAAGEKTVYQRIEIWSEGDNYAARSDDGTLTVNNGEQHWTIKPNQKEVILLPVLSDTQDFDLRQEAQKAVKYPHKVLGKDSIAGRKANRIEISPPGGLPYYLWVDAETNLPVQLQTAMQKAVQTTYTFVNFEPNTQVQASTFTYDPPQGYKIVDQNPDKQVADLNEAIKISGINPIKLPETPQRILANQGRIVFDYDDTIVTESKVSSPLVISPTAALGQAAGGPLEVLQNSLRWQQNGLEIKVQGPRAEQLAKELAVTLVMPQAGQETSQTPKAAVDVDMNVVRNNQQQVDAGSSPWQLDPQQVAFTFIALQMSPGGITGQPPLDYSDLKITTNTGTEAIVQVNEGPTKTVYLKRLVRQDETGIWTVVGYDLR